MDDPNVYDPSKVTKGLVNSEAWMLCSRLKRFAPAGPMAGMNRRPCASLGLALLVLWSTSSLLTWLLPSSPNRTRLAGQSNHAPGRPSKVLRMAVGGRLKLAGSTKPLTTDSVGHLTWFYQKKESRTITGIHGSCCISCKKDDNNLKSMVKKYHKIHTTYLFII